MGKVLRGKCGKNSADIGDRNIRFEILVPKKGLWALPGTYFYKWELLKYD